MEEHFVEQVDMVVSMIMVVVDHYFVKEKVHEIKISHVEDFQFLIDLVVLVM